MRNASNERRIGTAALIRGRLLITFLSQMRRLFEGGAYSSKYGKRVPIDAKLSPVRYACAIGYLKMADEAISFPEAAFLLVSISIPLTLNTRGFCGRDCGRSGCVVVLLLWSFPVQANRKI